MCPFAFRVCNGYIRYMTRHEISAGGWLDMVTGEGASDNESAGFDSALAELSADDVDPSDWDIWVEGLRRRETVYRNARLRLEALRAGEVLPVCAQCGETIVGRSDARYCSTRCRVAAHRAKPKAPESKEPTVDEMRRRADEFEARMIAEGKWQTKAERKADREASVDEWVQSLIAKKKPKAGREAEDRAYAAELNQAMAAKPKRR